MKRKTVKRVVLFFFIFLPLQYVAVGVVGVLKREPWPAFVLPGFKTVYDSSHYISLDEVTFYFEDTKNAKVIEIDPQKLFAGLPKSQLEGFLRRHFSGAKIAGTYTQETKRWLLMQIQKEVPSFHADKLNVEWRREQIINPKTAESKSPSRLLQHFSIVLQ